MDINKLNKAYADEYITKQQWEYSMKKPRKHAELIKAWADGAVIERLWNGTHEKAWLIDNEPMWEEWEEYRIKPEPKPDVVVFISCHGKNLPLFHRVLTPESSNLKLTFDGETGELWDAQVLKNVS